MVIKENSKNTRKGVKMNLDSIIRDDDVLGELCKHLMCNWKRVLNSNSTTFEGRTEDNLECIKCDGYRTECSNYTENIGDDLY